MPTAVLVSFRLGVADGVSVVAETWRRALVELGYDVTTVAGAGDADRIVVDLDPGRRRSVDEARLSDVIGAPDVVVVENVLTMPVDLEASLALAAVLRGRPAVLHHHDPPWQVAGREHVTALPPDDPAWRHVVVNQRTREEFAARGLTATVIYNGFDTERPCGDRAGTRARLGVAADERLLLHPVRAIPRKNVPGAIALAEAVAATYWLPGPAEDGYGPTP